MDVEETESLHAAGPIRSAGQGRYVVQAPLGEGGMASVYRAYDTVLGRTVAVKTLHADLARDPSFRERFRREAQAVAALNHVNIVAVHDSGEDTGPAGVVPYIVMEYVQGRSVRELVREAAAGRPGGTLPLDRALAVTAAVLDALECSHRQGLIHRDIKPANVMTTDDGTVKVMDFGIARALQSDATAMTRTGTVLGTPQYLSPEQAQGRTADARSDLYSVGCMLFELVTGTLPFDGESAMSVLYQHVQQPPPVPSSINPSLPPAIDAVVARALSKDPAGRHRSARAMAEDIRRAAAGDAPTRPLHSAPTVTAEHVHAEHVHAEHVHAEHVHAEHAESDDAEAGRVDSGDTGAGAGPGRPFAAFTGAGGGDTAESLAEAVRYVTIRQQAQRQTLRSARIVAWAAVPVVALVWAVSTFAAPDLFGAAVHTPDPRATGPYLSCDPVATGGDAFNPPSFSGMSPAEARTCAEIAGLKIDQKSTTGAKYNKDTVTRQEPGISQSVKRGSTVTVWVSQGGDPRAKGDLANCEVEEQHGKVPTPWLKGRTLNAARTCADIAHLTLVEAGKVQDRLTPAGQVARQEPGSEDTAVGSTVKVWISTGGDPRAVGDLAGCDSATGDQPEAPALEHMTVANARTCADIGHFKLQEQSVPDTVWPSGEVVRQEPRSYSRIDPGSTIGIWVSSGAP
ncbi:Stk1 family PASTA domain-containing Ser/Thr kinase [Kitasatospora sp. DSM 101779]|uniref:Stk1 family PASTA domain-containing Ser/Thr kinase n=1 Tax=Kitasatospora sp. DSM 101779 TaxID=2853165 RepID=UPI0021DB7674|nr:Stk1 family PASTA domain-containing Ser/Thr kinase [Kitasatospora sp. DSM 101779]MCU7825999.1 Stk1 family PASTA domain-containing Ser/Thr kinase [Kitasatospora sp. DSM 101779]